MGTIVREPCKPLGQCTVPVTGLAR